MINHESGEGGRIPTEFSDALDSALYAGSKVFGVPSPVHYFIEITDEESAVCFPVHIEHVSDDLAKIKIHLESFLDHYGFDEDAEDYQHQDLSLADVAKIHVAASVIPHMLICAINPRNKKIVAQLNSYMSFPDTLTNDIANTLLTLGVFEVRLRELVLQKSADEIAEINRYRLAIGALCYNESDAGLEATVSRQQVDFTERVSGIFLERLMELPTDLERYMETSKMFKLDEHTAQNNFFAEISSLEIAGPFPMKLPEIMLLAQIVAGNRN